MKKSKILLFHDHFLYTGGAEKLCMYLIDHLKCDVAAFFVSDQTYDLSEYKVYSLIKKYPTKWLNVWKYIYFVFKTSFLKKYEIIIFSGDSIFASFSASFAKKKIYYCHCLPRYLFDQYESSKARRRWYLRWLYILGVKVQRWLYKKHVQRVNTVLCNSVNIQTQLKTYIGVESSIIYPPVDIIKYIFQEPQDYYFSFARLDRLKRVDKIIEAFKRMPDKKLYIASTGPERDKLEKSAQGCENIKFLGRLSDKELIDYLSKCIATIYIPINEDFGMTAVESLAAGKPVIGVEEGGLKESIIPNETGILLPSDLKIEDICNAIHILDKTKSLSMRDRCIERSEAFDLSFFLSKFDRYIN